MTSPADDGRLLEDFKATGSRDSLLALLRAHQNRIYNVCFQVLNRTQDAEDATQNALLKVAEGARTATDADAFAGWIYRVSIRAALDVWRRRETARRHEKRSVMARPDSVPFDDPERRALFEAMERLDDGDRTLVIQHYFEKVPLETLGARRGISAVAIWKRIDRAREKLKKLLLGAGFVSASGAIAEALESAIPASAPPSLMLETVLGKILAGGIAVTTTKGTLWMAAAAALLIFGFGIAGWRYFKAGDTAKPQIVDSLKTTTAPADPVSSVESSSPAKAAPLEPPKQMKSLRETLRQYKAWVANWKATGTHSNQSHEFRRQARQLFTGARELILDDPETFLEFLQDPANKDVSDTLTGDLLLQIETRERGQVFVRHPYGSFPAPLMEGITALVKDGPAALKTDLLMFLFSVDEVPQGLNQAVAGLLADSDSQVQYWAIGFLGRTGRPLPSDVEKRLMELIVFRGESDMKGLAIHAVSGSENPETRAWMLDRLERNRDPDLLAPLAEGAAKLVMKRPDESASLDRLTSLLTNVLKSGLQESYAERVLLSALRLPAAHATQILQAAQYQALPPRLVTAISVVLDRIGSGVNAPGDLQAAFKGALEASRGK